ncbi:hypothetical protein [Pseudoalteromonas sp. S554]|uniref:hypothetical protein n=1 Tax=Pseudoalteromonas sp. S554 TaxID=2066516 RepID=UPI00110D18B8|nr:hypothetical protein [Pseudoalteromonas sp. S554]TMS80558.1 hypothetical protein CWB65_14665 [Pseudoalteromonas sp. S554]
MFTPLMANKSNKLIKYHDNDVIIYMVENEGQILSFLELGSTTCGNYWVRHCATAETNLRQGLSHSLYLLAMADVYPMALAPSRECTSAHAIPLWQKLYLNEQVIKSPVTNETTYCTEFDEWFDEILEVNPLQTEEYISSLECNFSLFSAVKSGLINPHPYNTLYRLDVNHEVNIIASSNGRYKSLCGSLFDERYEQLDL